MRDSIWLFYSCARILSNVYFVYTDEMNEPLKNIIVDSAILKEDALIQNPGNPAPEEIVRAQDILIVEYYGFDGALHRGQIVMNKAVMQDMKIFFETALAIKFPLQKVIPISHRKYAWDDIISCNDNNSSGYNYRFIMGTNRMSKHALGLAFDINPVQNIYVRYDEHMREIFRLPKDGVYDKNATGTLTSDHPLVALMKGLGWDWGGNWTPQSGRMDYQHFEKN